MHEGVAHLTAGGRVLDQRGARRFLERVEEVVLVDTLERGEEIEAKGLAGERRNRQDTAAVVAHALEALPDHQADAARHVIVGNLQVRAPAALRIEELASLVEVAEHLFDEEGVSLGFREDERDQLGRGLASSKALEDGADARLGHAAQHDLLGQPLAQEAGQHAAERAPGLELGVAIGPHHEHRDLRQPLRRVLHEQQRRFVGPVEVFEHEHERFRARGALDELGDHCTQQVVALLLGRQRHRVGNVRVAYPQLGHELGDLGRVLPERLAERLGRNLARRLLDVLDAWGGRAAPLAGRRSGR